jgi:hypothetical protein
MSRGYGYFSFCISRMERHNQKLKNDVYSMPEDTFWNTYHNCSFEIKNRYIKQRLKEIERRRQNIR